MKKSLLSLIVLSLALGLPTQATAATKQSKFQQVNKTFQALLTDGNDALDALEAEFEKNIDALDNDLLRAKLLAEKTYQESIIKTRELLSPQIADATDKIARALNDFSQYNEVTILKQFGSPLTILFAGSYLQCPKTDEGRPALTVGGSDDGKVAYEVVKTSCVNNDGNYPIPDKSISKRIKPGNVVRGEQWNIGDKATIYIKWGQPLTPTSSVPHAAHLSSINEQLLLGNIKMTFLNEYQKINSVLQTEPLILDSLQMSAEKAAKENTSRRSASIELASKTRDSLLADISETYQYKKDALEIQASIAEDAVAAAKRASKNPEIFDKAFTVAYKFEYNRRMLSELADTEWSGTWTYRTINSLVKIARLADTADSIAAKYSYKNALAFNSSIGIGFTGEPEFRATLKVVVAKYQKATGTRIAISA
jgi:hypothetical protein